MRQQYQLIWSKTRLLGEQVSNSAMHATRDAAAQQNAQRKSAHLRMKEHISNDLCVRLVSHYFLSATAFEKVLYLYSYIYLRTFATFYNRALNLIEVKS